MTRPLIECVWGKVQSAYQAGITALPPVVQISVLIPDTNETITGTLQPGPAGWYFPLVSEQVMVIIPRGDRAPGNALIVPNPNGSQIARDTLFKWLQRLMLVFTTWTPLPNDGGAALKTLLTTFMSIYPVPDTLTNALIVENVP